MDGMTHAMERLADQAHPAFPVTIFYAFKQSEVEGQGITSTGWETFLNAVIKAGFGLTGTWPMRTEGAGRIVAKGTNALASSIVLVCRPRPVDAPMATRREFLEAIKSELPDALRQMQQGNIAPVDLAQAAIGPGMGVYTRYGRVLDAAGETVSVREALSLVNQTLDEVLAEQEGDFDADTRWALAWFEQSGFCQRRVRRGGDVVDGQEHKRCGHDGSGDTAFGCRQGAFAATQRAARGLGPGQRQLGSSRGRWCTIWSACMTKKARTPPPR